MPGKLHDFGLRLAASQIGQLAINKVSMERAQKRLKQSARYMGRLVAVTNGRNAYNADQIIDTRFKSFDFRCLVHLNFRSYLVRLSPNVARRSRRSFKNSSGGTKKGFSWRIPPMITIGCVRITSTTMSPPNFARSYTHIRGFFCIPAGYCSNLSRRPEVRPPRVAPPKPIPCDRRCV